MGKESIPHVLFVFTYLLWVTLAFAPPRQRSISLAKNSTIPPLPSEDPFYNSPPRYENASPGAILRMRKAQGLPTLIANCSAAYNILYRTTDSNYKPSWAVTTLLTPQTTSFPNPTMNGSTAASGSVLLSYQIAYDSVDVNDSPSYALYTASIDSLIPEILGLGWYVNIPDYEGPLASFTAGVQSGHATLDSVRAVLTSGLGLNGNDTKYALSGYSGGALASEWAAELQVQYAPELHFAGASLGGLPTNMISVVETVVGGPFSVLSVIGILGLTSQDAVAREYIMSQLKTSGPYNATGFLVALHQNLITSVVEYADQNIFSDYFTSGASVLEHPPLQTLLNRDGIQGYHGVPSMPLYIYKAIGDEISPVADTDALVERYCAVGANILYQRNTVGGHVTEGSNGAPANLAFLKAVLGGTYAAEYQTRGCTIQNVTTGNDTSEPV